MLKKIISESEKAKKKQRDHIIIGVLMIVLLVVSSLALAFMQDKEDSTQKESYNGYEFVRNSGLWQLTLSEQSFSFNYLPKELENVSITGLYDLTSYSNKPLYIINNNYASQNLIYNIGRYVLRYQDACLENLTIKNNCDASLPKKTCDDNLIVYIEANETKLWQNKNCVYISGDYEKGTDAFIYKILGII